MASTCKSNSDDCEPGSTGRIGGSAVESMARQPEVADKVQGAMIVSAALIEGATFFALLVCLLRIFIK